MQNNNNEWQEVRLGNLVRINEKSISKSFSHGTIEYLDTSSVTEGFFVEPQIIELKDAPSRAKRIVRDNDILISTVRPNLKHFGFVAKTKPNLIASTGFAVISCKNIFPKYLYYFLSTNDYTNYLSNIADAQTSTYPAFNPSVIEDTIIKLPPLETQKQIASTLSAYDDQIENNLQRIATLEKSAQDLYKEWFVRFRVNGEALPTDAETGLPAGWEVRKLSEMVNIRMGQSPSSEFYNEEGEGLPFHQGVGSYGHRFPTHDVFCTEITRIANEGDILFSVRAPVGRLNITDKKIIIGRGLSAMRHKENLQSYLFYLLQDAFQVEDIIGNGSIFNAVSKIELENFKVIDAKGQARKFNEIVLPIDNEIQTLQSANQTLRQTRDRLLPRLMSGELQPQNIQP